MKSSTHVDMLLAPWHPITESIHHRIDDIAHTPPTSRAQVVSRRVPCTARLHTAYLTIHISPVFSVA